MVVGAAAVVNIRRLHRFWQEKIRAKQGGSQQEGGQKEQMKGRARLFFLCFEQLGRYNGYRMASENRMGARDEESGG
jgi:hypothetical protein